MLLILLLCGFGFYVLFRAEKLDFQAMDLEQTFQTRDRALQQELRLIAEEKAFREDLLCAGDLSFEENLRLLRNFAADDGKSRELGNPHFSYDYFLIAESVNLLRFMSAPYLPSKSVLPLKRVFSEEAFTPRIGELLLAQLDGALKHANYAAAQECLDSLFRLARLGLRADFPDSSGIHYALEGLTLFLTRGAAAGRAEWEKTEEALAVLLNERFPQTRFIAARRVEILQQFERARLNGASIFFGDRLPRMSFADAFREFRFGKLFTAFSTGWQDFFYPIDRDELFALGFLRRLQKTEFIPIQLYPSFEEAGNTETEAFRLSRLFLGELESEITRLTEEYSRLEEFRYAIRSVLGTEKDIPATNSFDNRPYKLYFKPGAMEIGEISIPLPVFYRDKERGL